MFEFELVVKCILILFAGNVFQILASGCLNCAVMQVVLFDQHPASANINLVSTNVQARDNFSHIPYTCNFANHTQNVKPVFIGLEQKVHPQKKLNNLFSSPNRVGRSMMQN